MVERRGSSGLRRRALAVLSLLALVFAACGSSTATSSSGTTRTATDSGPAITVEPSTGVAGGQASEVNGTGFPPWSGVELGQCAGGGRDRSTCDASTAFQATAGADGAFTTTHELRAVIGVASGLVDCSLAGACELVAGVRADPTRVVAAPLRVVAEPAAFAEPTCPGPYPPIGYLRGAVEGPRTPPNVRGTPRSYADAGAAVSITPDGDDLVLSVGYRGATRTFTTAPHGAGGNEDRTPGPSDTRYGAVSIVTADDGAVYVTLEQSNSGDHARIGWRFDDPCAPA